MGTHLSEDKGSCLPLHPAGSLPPTIPRPCYNRNGRLLLGMVATQAMGALELPHLMKKVTSQSLVKRSFVEKEGCLTRPPLDASELCSWPRAWPRTHSCPGPRLSLTPSHHLLHAPVTPNIHVGPQAVSPHFHVLFPQHKVFPI